MPQSVVIYSEIIPTALAIVALYFIGSGVLDHNRTYTILGIILFALAVIIPFAVLSFII